MIAPNRLVPMGAGMRGWRCARHDLASSRPGWTCPKCPTDLAPNRALSREAGCAGADLTRPTPAIPKPRAGAKSEDALYAALVAAGYTDMGESEAHHDDDVRRMFLRQYPWGAYLDEPRRFSSDAAFPFASLLIEVEGGAHGVQRMRKHDVLRRQLAESAGWRVLSVLPEQVRDGSAVELVRKAIESAHAEGGRDE